MADRAFGRQPGPRFSPTPMVRESPIPASSKKNPSNIAMKPTPAGKRHRKDAQDEALDVVRSIQWNSSEE